MNNQENWYQSFFTGIAIKFWQKAITPEYTKSEIDFIKKLASLSGSANILDVPCGFGRHSTALAQEGHSITAIDISEEYINHLAHQAKQMQLNIHTVNADILTHSIEGVFDVAICLGNSFSYFSADTMKTFIAKIYNSLEQQGCFIIHTGMLAESILPSMNDRNWMQVDDILYLNENIYHPTGSVLQTNYHFIQNGKTEAKTAWHFVYTTAEVIRMLADAGFTDVDVYSDFELHPFKLRDRQAYFKACK